MRGEHDTLFHLILNSNDDRACNTEKRKLLSPCDGTQGGIVRGGDLTVCEWLDVEVVHVPEGGWDSESGIHCSVLSGLDMSLKTRNADHDDDENTNFI